MQELIKLSKSPDELTRVSAIARLAKYGSSEVLPRILDALKDPSANVKITALNALKEIGDSRAVPALIAVLKEKDSPLGEAFFSVSQPSFRSMAAEALGIIGDKRAVPALINMADHDWISQRFFAAKALGQIGDPAGLPHIKNVKDALKDMPFLENQLNQFIPAAEKITPRKTFKDLEQSNPDAVRSAPGGGKLIQDLDESRRKASPKRKPKLFEDL